MSKAPSMPMYWDAYIADTTHLTTEEHGAYLLLLAAMWRRNGSVPDSDKDIARIVGLTPAKWRRTKARLAEFLVIENGEITQKNLQKIWKNTQEKIAKNRANGAKGGRPVSNKNKDLAKANGSVSDSPNKSIPEPEPDSNRDTIVSLALSAPKPRRAERFEEFWNQYPHRNGAKKGKAKAKARYERHVAAGVPERDIIAGALRYANDRQVIEGFAKDPTTWLNNEGWNDDIEPMHAPQHNHQRGGTGQQSSLVGAFAAVAERRSRDGRERC